ncbi:MAG: hypothetical protein V7637_5152 [Mycobacteriales bacterium]|jgi:hypothetical protein
MPTTTSSTLARTTRRELGALFRSGTAGDIPDGRGRGSVLLGTGGRLGQLVAALCYLLVWRGKVVDAKAGRLKNILTPAAVKAIEAAVYEAPSWYDGEPCIVLDYSRTSFVARKIRDEIREVRPGLFVGLVFWRRWHVLDFALDFTRRR